MSEKVGQHLDSAQECKLMLPPTEPDLTMFIGSKNLYARFEKPAVETSALSVKTGALPSSRSSKPQPAAASGAGPSRPRVVPSSTTAGPRVPAARAAKASAPPPATAGLRKVTAHTRSSSRATSVLNSSLATVRPPATSRAPSATTVTTVRTTSMASSVTKASTTSRTGAPPVTRQRAAAALSHPPSVTATKSSRPTTRSTSTTTSTAASRTGAAPGRVTRQTSGTTAAGKTKQLAPVPVVIAEEEIIEEDLMVPQTYAFDDFDFDSLILTEREEAHV